MTSYFEQEEIVQNLVARLSDYNNENDIVVVSLEQQDDFDLIINVFFSSLVDIPYLFEKDNGLHVLEEKVVVQEANAIPVVESVPICSEVVNELQESCLLDYKEGLVFAKDLLHFDGFDELMDVLVDEEDDPLTTYEELLWQMILEGQSSNQHDGDANEMHTEQQERPGFMLSIGCPVRYLPQIGSGRASLLNDLMEGDIKSPLIS